MRYLAAALVYIGLGLPGGPQSYGQSAQRPVFRAAADVVTVDVSVRRRNRPVEGLAADDFELHDNGVRQQFELQAAGGVPVDVTVVFQQDHDALVHLGRRFASSTLEKIAGYLRPSDRLRVIAFARDVREVLAMKEAGGWRGRELPDPAPPQADQNHWDSASDPTLGDAPLFDALFLALARPPEVGRRHLVVAFTLGSDYGGVLSDGVLFNLLASRTEALLHVAFWDRGYNYGTPNAYTLEGLRGLYVRSAVTAAAQATGGEVHNTRNGAGAFKSIFEDFRQRYLLRYAATGVTPGGWHTIEVRTPQHPDYDVRARSGYLGR